MNSINNINSSLQSQINNLKNLNNNGSTQDLEKEIDSILNTISSMEDNINSLISGLEKIGSDKVGNIIDSLNGLKSILDSENESLRA